MPVEQTIVTVRKVPGHAADLSSLSRVLMTKGWQFILLGRSDNDRRLAAIDEGMHLPLILGQLLARQRGR